MLSKTLVYSIIIIYMLFLLLIAILEVKKNSNKSAQNFATGKGSISWPCLIMTYLSSLLNTWIFLAAPGAYYRGGFVYFMTELSFICAFPFIMHFVMNKVWLVNDKLNFTTPSDFFYERFKSKPLRLITALIFIASAFPYITSVIVAIAKSAVTVSGGSVSYNQVIFIIGIVVVIYVILGGMSSIAITDTIQGFIFLTILWGIVASGMGIGFKGSVVAAVNSIWDTTREWFSYPGPAGTVTYIYRFSYPLSCIIGFLVMTPHSFVRTGYSGQNLDAQRKLMFVMPPLQLFVRLGCACIGLLGIALIPALSSGDTELLIPYLINNVIMNSSSSLGFVLTIGFLISVLAVGVSTADSLLLVSGSIISKDIIQGIFNINHGEKRNLIMMKVIIAFIGLISVLFALNPPSLIYTLIMFACSIVMPLFSILVIGIYWKKATKQAAVISSIVGTVLVIMTYFVWHIGNDWYGALGLLGSTVCMIVISLVTKQTEEDSKEFYLALEEGQNKYYP